MAIPSLHFVSQAERKAYDFFTDEDLLTRARQHYKFFKENRTVQISIAEKILYGGAVGASLGALGSVVYNCYQIFQFARAAAVITDPKAVLLDRVVSLAYAEGFKIAQKAGLAAAIGGVGGCIFSARNVYLEMPRSPEFIKWKLLAIDRNVYQRFQAFIEANDQLADLRCPIGMGLITDPVIVNGVTYERLEILRWIASKQTPPIPFKTFLETISAHLDAEAPDPMQHINPVCVRNLIRNDDHLMNAAQQLKKLITEDLDPVVKKGILAFCKAADDEGISRYETEVSLITQEHTKGNLTVMQHANAVMACSRRYMPLFERLSAEGNI
jgi:hypothetical protein